MVHSEGAREREGGRTERRIYLYYLKAIIIYLQSSVDCAALSFQLFANPDIISPVDDCLPPALFAHLSRYLLSLSPAFQEAF